MAGQHGAADEISRLRQRLQSYADLDAVLAHQDQQEDIMTRSGMVWVNFGAMFIHVPGDLAADYIRQDRDSIQAELQQAVSPD